MPFAGGQRVRCIHIGRQVQRVHPAAGWRGGRQIERGTSVKGADLEDGVIVA